MKKLSVIIPVYGVESYIRQCLESIINQTLKDMEIIVVNDGTEDSSMKIVEEYLDDKRIKIINKKNGGLSSARNAGLKEAKGEYIAFIDSDDFIKNTMFEELFQKNNENYDIIYSNVIEYDDISQKINNRKKMKEIINVNREGVYHYKFCGMEVWNKIYKRDFLLRNNIFFEEGIIHEDNLFTLKCFFLARKVKYVNKYHYIYRKNRVNSILSLKKQKKELKAFSTILRRIIEFEKVYKNDEFSKIRLFIAELEHKSLLYRADYNKINLMSKEEISNLENKVIKQWKNFSKIEKKILRYDIINLLESRAFSNINLFNLFYWKNRLMTLKALRRILRNKLKK